jgi:hypothetical protein
MIRDRFSRFLGWFSFARLAWVSVILPAWSSTLPLIMAIMVLGAVVFSSNGLDPKDLLAAMRSSWQVRSAIWLIWLVFSTPVVVGIADSKRGLYLRTLPVPVWGMYASLVASVALVQVPWLVLIAVGQGWGAASAAFCTSLALQMSWMTRTRLGSLASMVGLTGLWLLTVPTVVLLLASALGLGISLRNVHRWGASNTNDIAWFRGVRSPSVALSLAMALSVIRTSGSTWMRGVLICAAGAGLMAAWIRNNAVGTSFEAMRVLAWGSPLCLTLVIAPWAQRFTHTQQGLSWLTKSRGIAGWRSTVAMGLASVGSAFPWLVIMVVVPLYSLPVPVIWKAASVSLLWMVACSWILVMTVHVALVRKGTNANKHDENQLVTYAGLAAALGMVLVALGQEILWFGTALAVLFTTAKANRVSREG